MAFTHHFRIISHESRPMMQSDMNFEIKDKRKRNPHQNLTSYFYDKKFS
jgi:hypothetical protein